MDMGELFSGTPCIYIVWKLADLSLTWSTDPLIVSELDLNQIYLFHLWIEIYEFILYLFTAGGSKTIYFAIRSNTPFMSHKKTTIFLVIMLM